MKALKCTRELTIEELAAVPDDEIDFSDLPEMAEIPLVAYVVRSLEELIGREDVTWADWRRAQMEHDNPPA